MSRLKCAWPFALALAALALSGCESTQEKSAALERTAHREAHKLDASTVSVSRENSDVQIVSSTVLSDEEGAALAVVLRNRSAQPIAEAPIEVQIDGASGSMLYTNAVPGLSRSLTTAPLLAAHATAVWVDDQITLSGDVGVTKALVGAGTHPTATIPTIRVHDVKQIEGGAGATGMVRNESSVEQRELVIDGLARRDGKIVAAGRGIVAELKPHASASFDLYLTGDPKGASLEVSVTPSTL